MAARDDLTGLLLPPAGTDPYRQGVIEAFDPATGANQVRVGGATLVDLPILVGGDTINFQPDDTVILLRYLSSWAILGRVVVPGNEALTAAAVDFYAGNDWKLTSSTIDTTFSETCQLVIPVPAWANAALVFASSDVTLTNPGASDVAFSETRLDGGGGGRVDAGVPNTNFVSISSHVARRIGVGGSGPLGSTITLGTWTRTNGFSWANGFVRGYLNAIVVFRKV